MYTIKFRTVITMAPAYITALVWLAGAAQADQSGPPGHWYLNCNGHAVSANISTRANRTYTGTLIDENGSTELLDAITWDASSRLLQFRRNRVHLWQWYSGSVVEGILVGRFSQSATSPNKPPLLSNYSLHVTGWNSSYLDTGSFRVSGIS